MTRDELFARDGHRCVYCGQIFPAERLTIDHVQARSRGGDESSGNIVTACTTCNAMKGRRRLAEFLADDPVARGNFLQYAIFVWPRHLRAIHEEVAARLRARAPGGRPPRPPDHS